MDARATILSPNEKLMTQTHPKALGRFPEKCQIFENFQVPLNNRKTASALNASTAQAEHLKGEADNQPISQSVREAVSQAVSWASRQAGRQKHTVWLFSVVDHSYKQ